MAEPTHHDRRPPGRPMPSALAAAGGLSLLLLLAGCEGSQSTLAPAGRAAERIADLWWWMAGGALVVWGVVLALAVYALRLRPRKHPHRQARWLIIGGGAVFPTVVLAVLLLYGLSLMPELLEPAPEGAMRIEVEGRQWWWRVRYLPAEGEAAELEVLRTLNGPVELANEIRLPVGRRVELLLRSTDVVHSFWIPSLSGKMDMIPGRVTRLSLEPTRTGVFRGACAEYCGDSHALMSLYAVVQEEEELTAWLEHQARPAAAPETALAERGRRLFQAHGCGACHAVRGTAADGRLGPDLTHVASRVSLGAGLLPTEAESYRRWIEHTDRVKPGVNMPSFGVLPDGDVEALVAYLQSLE